ncbi:MAG: hypothetical protein R3346_00590 [Candidatus Spechtbacterales bacterium]|nr:hypothetical protein [Candidatus Spechtbacterales bacterium]
MSRRFKKGPTLEAIEELGITRRTKPGEVDPATFIKGAALLWQSEFAWAVDNEETRWAYRELERLLYAAVSATSQDELTEAIKPKHSLAALRCATSRINKAEVNVLEEEARREASSNNSSQSLRESRARKERKRARDREIRARMKGKSQ